MLIITSHKAVYLCAHPIQQHGRRLPSESSFTVRKIWFSLVFACLTLITQHIHSLRANGVKLCHASYDFLFDISANLRSLGTLCATPLAKVIWFMKLVYSRCMKLYIIRHGETDANSEGIIQGWLDYPINEKGAQQAAAAADSFLFKVDVIFSSDLLRAKQTAQYFTNKFPDAEYYEDGRLRERYLGAAQGKHKDDQDWIELMAKDELKDVDGAETLVDFTSRIQSFIAFLKETTYESVLIVSHGGTIARMKHLAGGDSSYKRVENATVDQLDI